MGSIMAFCGICLFLTAQLHFDLLVPIFHLVFEMHNGFFWILCLSSNVSIIAAFYQHIFLGQMKSQCPVAPSQGKAQYSTLLKEDGGRGKRQSIFTCRDGVDIPQNYVSHERRREDLPIHPKRERKEKKRKGKER